MPGGRLTHDDRRQIATWLAEGLGYAEIARRLGRPTSTISREVARAGGGAGYRADHAQRTAGRRPPRPPRPPAPDPADGAFVDHFAALLAATGLPRMTARVFVALLIADGLTSADLVRRLRVSPASVSKAIAQLEGLALATRTPDPGARRDRYRVDEDVWLQAWQSDTGAHGRIAAAAREGVDLFGATTLAGTRLHAMSEFFGRLSEQMAGTTLTDPTVHDALTVVAALVHAAHPLQPDALAAALGWSTARTGSALTALHDHPAIADPLVVRVVGSGALAVAARPDRLTCAQRAALTGR